MRALVVAEGGLGTGGFVLGCGRDVSITRLGKYV